MERVRVMWRSVKAALLPMSTAMAEDMRALNAARDRAIPETDGAKPAAVFREIRSCAAGWEGEARILGNVRAADLVRAADAALIAVEVLEYIANAKPHTWEPDMRDQFQEWAQSRARAALAGKP